MLFNLNWFTLHIIWLFNFITMWFKFNGSTRNQVFIQKKLFIIEVMFIFRVGSCVFYRILRIEKEG